MMLEVDNLFVDYEGEPVLRGVSVQAAGGEVVAVLGPSGCGKTTLLRAIGGLETPTSGDIRLEGRSLLGVPPHQRGVGMVFQSFALFQHMNVLDNVLFGLQMQHMEASAANQRARELLDVVGMAGFERRAVGSLSGGEQQRVALARSLAPGPRLLMLDEPLGSLDAALRERLTDDLRAIFRRVGITALYVTHDQREAFAIADQLVLMRAGLVEQHGVPEAVYREPDSEFAAGFLGLGNCLPRAVLARWLPGVVLPSGGDTLLIHPEGLLPGAAPHPLPPARVVDCVFLGDVYRLTLAIEGVELTMRVPLHEFGAVRVRAGETLQVSIDPAWLHPLRDND